MTVSDGMERETGSLQAWATLRAAQQVAVRVEVAEQGDLGQVMDHLAVDMQDQCRQGSIGIGTFGRAGCKGNIGIYVPISIKKLAGAIRPRGARPHRILR